MNTKRENIISATIKLFLQDGYHATSTKNIATKANVSEGLIFKHFTNKETLLQAVLQYADDILQQHIDKIIYEPDPNKAIQRTIELPFKLVGNEKERELWKMKHKLKWELNLFRPESNFEFQTSLTINLTKLGFASPAVEAEFLINSIEGISAALINDQIKDKKKLLQFLKSKYNI